MQVQFSFKTIPDVSYTYQCLLVSLTLAVSTDPSLLDYSDHVTKIKLLYGGDNYFTQNKHHSARKKTKVGFA